MQRTLQQIRNDVRLLIDQSSSNSDFTDDELNGLINEGVQYLASLVEYPRDIIYIQTEEGIPSYTLLSDTMKLLTAYFGDRTKTGDLQRLEIITQERLADIDECWLENTEASKDRPRWVCLLDRKTVLIHPRPKSSEVKTLFLGYVYYPAVLSSDGDYPDLPPMYHEFVSHYAAHLCYLGRLKNPAVAKQMLDGMMAKVKSVQPQVTNEIMDLYFQFGNDDTEWSADAVMATNRIVP